MSDFNPVEIEKANELFDLFTAGCPRWNQLSPAVRAEARSRITGQVLEEAIDLIEEVIDGR